MTTHDWVLILCATLGSVFGAVLVLLTESLWGPPTTYLLAKWTEHLAKWRNWWRV